MCNKYSILAPINNQSNYPINYHFMQSVEGINFTMMWVIFCITRKVVDKMHRFSTLRVILDIVLNLYVREDKIKKFLYWFYDRKTN